MMTDCNPAAAVSLRVRGLTPTGRPRPAPRPSIDTGHSCAVRPTAPRRPAPPHSYAQRITIYRTLMALAYSWAARPALGGDRCVGGRNHYQTAWPARPACREGWPGLVQARKTLAARPKGRLKKQDQAVDPEATPGPARPGRLINLH